MNPGVYYDFINQEIPEDAKKAVGAEFDAYKKNAIDLYSIAISKGEDCQSWLEQITKKNLGSVNWLNKDGNPSLVTAILNKNLTAVTFLKTKGADLTWKNSKDKTILHFAAESDDLNIVNELKINEENKEAKDSDGRMPYQLATNPEVVSLLMPKSIKNDKKGLDVANFWKIVKTPTNNKELTEEEKKTINTIFDNISVEDLAKMVDGPRGFTPLHYVAAHGNLYVINKLDEKLGKKLDLNARIFKEKKTPLYFAAATKNFSFNVLEKLITLGANPVDIDREGDGVLHVIVKNTLRKIAPFQQIKDLALEKDFVKKYITLQDNKLKTPIGLAIDIGCNDPSLVCRSWTVISDLLSIAGESLLPRDQKLIERRFSFFVTHALALGDVDVEKERVFKNFSINCSAIAGRALLEVIRDYTKGDIEKSDIFQKNSDLFIESGARCLEKDEDNNTPLHYIAEKYNDEVCEALIKKLKQPELNSINKAGQTALHRAVIRGSAQMVFRLLNAGANIEIADTFGRTPIFYAIINKSKEIFDKLIEKNANLNLIDNDKNSPFYYAALRKDLGAISNKIIEKKGASYTDLDKVFKNTGNNADQVILFLRSGIDINAPDKFGVTLWQHFANNDDIKDELIRAGVTQPKKVEVVSESVKNAQALDEERLNKELETLKLQKELEIKEKEKQKINEDKIKKISLLFYTLQKKQLDNLGNKLSDFGSYKTNTIQEEKKEKLSEYLKQKAKESQSIKEEKPIKKEEEKIEKELVEIEEKIEEDPLASSLGLLKIKLIALANALIMPESEKVLPKEGEYQEEGLLKIVELEEDIIKQEIQELISVNPVDIKIEDVTQLIEKMAPENGKIAEKLIKDVNKLGEKYTKKEETIDSDAIVKHKAISETKKEIEESIESLNKAKIKIEEEKKKADDILIKEISVSDDVPPPPSGPAPAAYIPKNSIKITVNGKQRVQIVDKCDNVMDELQKKMFKIRMAVGGEEEEEVATTVFNIVSSKPPVQPQKAEASLVSDEPPQAPDFEEFIKSSKILPPINLKKVVDLKPLQQGDFFEQLKKGVQLKKVEKEIKKEEKPEQETLNLLSSLTELLKKQQGDDEEDDDEDEDDDDDF